MQDSNYHDQEKKLRSLEARLRAVESFLSHLPSFSSYKDIDEIDDELLEEAARIVCNYDRATASLLQRKLNIGYNRASRILDQLHEAGAVSAANGSKPREVLITDAKEFLASFQK